MYALDGNYCFPIYWLDIPLSVFGFDYEKLNTLEIRALAVLDAFRVVKFKDLLHMANDPEQISKFISNAYICLLLLFINLILLFFLTLHCSFISN